MRIISWFGFLTACCLVTWLAPLATADDATIEATPKDADGKPAVESKNKNGEGKKDEAETKKEEKPEVKLLKMFKEHQSITNTLGVVMVWVPKDYRAGKYEVTQREFELVMKTNPSKFKGDQHPVENVSWEEANEFCKKLTEKERMEGKLPKSFYYALPSETQWEYFVDEATLKDAVTSLLGDRHNTENVGLLGPNKYGLHDVRGNVSEWCSSPVARGGSWRNYEDYLAITFRYTGSSDTRLDDVGFRCVLMGE